VITGRLPVAGFAAWLKPDMGFKLRVLEGGTMGPTGIETARLRRFAVSPFRRSLAVLNQLYLISLWGIHERNQST
jgi:hypothetical protein